MIITLVAALSLAASAALDVPYLPQTDVMCGGAAAAMVFRYWGDAHADVQELAPLVDRRAGGIADEVLVGAVRARGWRVDRVAGSLDALRARLDQRQPVIVLIADRGDRYHYVVVIGASADAVQVHDPAWGPSRSIRAADFVRLWKASEYWSMVILPPVPTTTAPGDTAAPTVITPAASTATPAVVTACDERLNRAVAQLTTGGLDQADALLGPLRADCPRSSRPTSELSAVRFAQHRWRDAAALAREALTIDPRDEYALDLLGSSLFMQDDEVGALRAWNQIGKPRVNLVRIEGLHRTRYQAIADALDIRANALLTADAFERARRRLAELPDQSTARLAVRPESDGFATVDVVIAERATIPRGVADWSATAVRAAVDREATLAMPGFTGEGDIWSASWRWWNNRPAVGVAFTTPHVRGLPGVWRVEAGWQSDAYSLDANGPAPVTRETRAHAALTMSDWLSGSVRYALTAGFDSWNDATKAVALGGSLERRLFDDRIALSGDASRWMPVSGAAPFQSAGARAALRSSTDRRGWVFGGTAGLQAVSDAAPLGLWPGAGDGHAREPLLRAHPLLSDGIVDLSNTSVFGRTLVYGGADAVRWLDRPSLVRVGVAAFADVARATRQATSIDTPAQCDIGLGVRIKVPGSAGVLRVDVAHGLRDGANALTVGIIR